MFAVIYRGFVYPEREQEYLVLWRQVAQYFIAHAGALGSCLHKTEQGEYVAYSRWPDQATRDASWGVGRKVHRAEIETAAEQLKACIDRSKPYDEICMEVVDDLGASASLRKLIHLDQESREFGFDWPNQSMIIDQAMDECREIREVLDLQESRERLQEEIGDLLHAAISLCDYSGFDVEETLAKVNKKYGGRIAVLKAITQRRGLENLQGQSLEFMLSIWGEAKKELL
jgi:NTP pyrophosphatase (non-canonical NTP hydrolase)